MKLTFGVVAAFLAILVMCIERQAEAVGDCDNQLGNKCLRCCSKWGLQGTVVDIRGKKDMSSCQCGINLLRKVLGPQLHLKSEK